MEKQYHIDFDDGHGALYAILPGDPGRVEKIASHFDNPRFFHQNREYTTWLGEVSGKTAMAVEGPPIPVEIAITVFPDTSPNHVVYSRF